MTYKNALKSAVFFASLAVAPTGGAFAQGLIADIDHAGQVTGGVTVQANTTQTYTYSFTAAQDKSQVTFGVRNDPAGTDINNASVLLGGTGSNLLTSFSGFGDGTVGRLTPHDFYVLLTVGSNYVLNFDMNMSGLGGSCCSVETTVSVGVGVPPSSDITSGGTFNASGLGGSVNPVFSGGTLLIDAPGTYAHNFTLDSSGTNRIDQNGLSANFSGVFSDAVAGTPGSISIINSGNGGRDITVTFSGVNTYTGTTTVGQNVQLLVAADSALGLGGALVLDGGVFRPLADLTLNRAIIVTGNNGYIWNEGRAVIMAGGITGPGNLMLDGGGTYTLTADSNLGGTLFVGSVQTLGNNTLYQNAVLTAGALVVEAGNELRGTGTINAPTTIFGTLHPGNSPGTLTFNAPVVQQAGSTLALDIDGKGTGNGAGNFSRVVVLGSGNSYTAAGLVQPILRGITGNASNTYTPALGSSFTIVTAAGGVKGSFAGVVQPSLGLAPNTEFDLFYSSNAIQLVVAPGDFGKMSGLTLNEHNAAVALQAVRNNPTFARAIGAIITSANYASAFAHAGAPIYGDALLAGLGRARAFGGVVQDQLAARRGAAPTPTGTSGIADLAGVTTWITALGGAARSGAAGNTGSNSNGAGFALGGDREVEPGIRLGFAGGFTSGRTTDRGTGGAADSNTAHIGTYGSYSLGRYFIDAQAFGTAQGDAIRRDIGTGAGRAVGQSTSMGGSGALEAGLSYRLAGFDLQPSASLRVDRLSRNRLTETGSDLGLGVNGGAATSARAGLNLRAQRDIPMAGYVLTAQARLGYAHEMADATTQTESAFIGATPAFRVVSAKTGRDAALLGGGLSLPLSPRLAVYATYGAELRSNYTGQTASIGARFSF